MLLLLKALPARNEDEDFCKLPGATRLFSPFSYPNAPTDPASANAATRTASLLVTPGINFHLVTLPPAGSSAKGGTTSLVPSNAEETLPKLPKCPWGRRWAEQGAAPLAQQLGGCNKRLITGDRWTSISAGWMKPLGKYHYYGTLNQVKQLYDKIKSCDPRRKRMG